MEGSGSFLTIGLQGGLGPRNVSIERPGALILIWRQAYLHVIATGTNVDLGDETLGQALQGGTKWAEVMECIWREWAPEIGAYMNEETPFNGQWRHDFYGLSYDKPVQIMRHMIQRIHFLFLVAWIACFGHTVWIRGIFAWPNEGTRNVLLQVGDAMAYLQAEEGKQPGPPDAARGGAS